MRRKRRIENIRNMGIIAHANHGKSLLRKVLVQGLNGKPFEASKEKNQTKKNFIVQLTYKARKKVEVEDNAKHGKNTAKQKTRKLHGMQQENGSGEKSRNVLSNLRLSN